MREEILKRGQKLSEEIDRISKLMDNTPEILTESSLSKVWRYSEENDIAIITAYRNKHENCLHYDEGVEEGSELSKAEKKERNYDLYSVLLNKGYGVTSIKGSYIENFETDAAKEVSEHSFFVVNRNNDDDFFDTLIKLSKFYCQDSVLLKPKGEDAYLFGTNNSPFPGLDAKFQLGKFKGGKDAEFMSKVKNRPFYFAEDFNVNSRFIMSERSKKIMKKMDSE